MVLSSEKSFSVIEVVKEISIRTDHGRPHPSWEVGRSGMSRRHGRTGERELGLISKIRLFLTKKKTTVAFFLLVCHLRK